MKRIKNVKHGSTAVMGVFADKKTELVVAYGTQHFSVGKDLVFIQTKEPPSLSSTYRNLSQYANDIKWERSYADDTIAATAYSFEQELASHYDKPTNSKKISELIDILHIFTGSVLVTQGIGPEFPMQILMRDETSIALRADWRFVPLWETTRRKIEHIHVVNLSVPSKDQLNHDDFLKGVDASLTPLVQVWDAAQFKDCSHGYFENALVILYAHGSDGGNIMFGNIEIARSGLKEILAPLYGASAIFSIVCNLGIAANEGASLGIQMMAELNLGVLIRGHGKVPAKNGSQLAAETVNRMVQQRQTLIASFTSARDYLGEFSDEEIPRKSMWPFLWNYFGVDFVRWAVK